MKGRKKDCPRKIKKKGKKKRRNKERERGKKERNKQKYKELCLSESMMIDELNIAKRFITSHKAKKNRSFDSFYGHKLTADS